MSTGIFGPAHWVRRSERSSKRIDYTGSGATSSGEEEVQDVYLSDEGEGSQRSKRKTTKRKSEGKSQRISSQRKKRRVTLGEQEKVAVIPASRHKKSRPHSAKGESLKPIQNILDNSPNSITPNLDVQPNQSGNLPDDLGSAIASSCSTLAATPKPPAQVSSSASSSDPFRQYTHLYSSPIASDIPAEEDRLPRSISLVTASSASSIDSRVPCVQSPTTTTSFACPVDSRLPCVQSPTTALASSYLALRLTDAPLIQPLTDSSLMNVRRVRPATLLDVSQVADIANHYSLSVLKSFPATDSEICSIFKDTTGKMNLPFLVFVENEGLIGHTPSILGFARAEYFRAPGNVMIHIVIRDGYAGSLGGLYLLYELLQDLKKIGRDNTGRPYTYPITKVFTVAPLLYTPGSSLPWKDWCFIEIGIQKQDMSTESWIEERPVMALYAADLVDLCRLHCIP